VWVIDKSAPKRLKRILACVNLDDGNEVSAPLNQKIMELATSLSRIESANLDVLTCWNVLGEPFLRHITDDERRVLRSETQDEYEQKMETISRPFRDKGFSFNALIESADPIKFIPEYVANHRINLLIMGTLARTGITGVLIGNTAESVLQQVNCSVLTIKPDGFVTPLAVSDRERG
jgi:nucleotide-binding universal stress UspA family protein